MHFNIRRICNVFERKIFMCPKWRICTEKINKYQLRRGKTLCPIRIRWNTWMKWNSHCMYYMLNVYFQGNTVSGYWQEIARNGYSCSIINFRTDDERIFRVLFRKTQLCSNAWLYLNLFWIQILSCRTKAGKIQGFSLK